VLSSGCSRRGLGCWAADGEGLAGVEVGPVTVLLVGEPVGVGPGPVEGLAAGEHLLRGAESPVGRVREVEAGPVRALHCEGDLGQGGLALCDDLRAGGYGLTDSGIADIHPQRLDGHRGSHLEVDAAEPGCGRGDTTGEGGCHRGNRYQQPLLPPGAAPATAVRALTGVTTPRGAALSRAVVLAGVDVMILAGRC